MSQPQLRMTTRPAIARTYAPDADTKQVYDRVYSIFRDLYELFGRSHVEWMHELKRIRTELSIP